MLPAAAGYAMSTSDLAAVAGESDLENSEKGRKCKKSKGKHEPWVAKGISAKELR